VTPEVASTTTTQDVAPIAPVPEPSKDAVPKAIPDTPKDAATPKEVAPDAPKDSQAVPSKKPKPAVAKPAVPKDPKAKAPTPNGKKNAAKAPTKKDPKNAAAKQQSPANKPGAKKLPAKQAQKRGVVTGKMDLAKKGTAAQSVTDFLGKKGGGGSTKSAMAETIGNELTGTELDLLNQHMKRFWNMPSGHEKAYDIVVEVELFIKPDGSVDKVVLVDSKRFQADSEFRIAAECALRAVLDPECSPLPLPADKYDTWKHMIFVFDPKEMCR
jgi:hypothetical protein